MSPHNPAPHPGAVHSEPQGQPPVQDAGEPQSFPHGHAPGQPPGPGVPPPQQPPAPKQKRSWFARHKILTTLLAVIAFIVVIAIATSGGDDGPVTEETGTSEQADAADEGADASATDGAADEETATDTEEPVEDEAAEGGEAEDVTEAESSPGLGDTVADGDFEFVVTDLEAGVERVGDEFLNTDAQGQFVLVHLSVTNIGNDSQTFFGSNQDLVDTEGRSHSADDSAAIYLHDSDAVISGINPGNTAEVTVVFDIPTDAEPAAIELHDSAFSGGVSVDLG